jgi:hypothetical protein
MPTVSPHDRVANVQGLPLFQGLPLSDRDEILSLARERRFAKNQTLFREGDPVEFIFLMVSGRVKITGSSRKCAAVILRIEESGGAVGGFGLASGSSHIWTAPARRRSRDPTISPVSVLVSFHFGNPCDSVRLPAMSLRAKSFPLRDNASCCVQVRHRRLRLRVSCSRIPLKFQPVSPALARASHAGDVALRGCRRH